MTTGKEVLVPDFKIKLRTNSTEGNIKQRSGVSLRNLIPSEVCEGEKYFSSSLSFRI